MLGLFGLVRENLDQQDKLDIKYKEVPSKPITDSCFLYVDAINNTGSGHSNSATTWKNLIGGTNGTKSGSISWENDALVLNGSGGFYFMKNDITTGTLELVLSVSAVPAQQSEILNNVQIGGVSIERVGRSMRAVWYNSNKEYSSTKTIPVELNKKIYLACSISNSKVLFMSHKYFSIDEIETTSKINYKAGKAYWTIGYNADPLGSTSSQVDYFYGRIYSARVHRRALSYEEIRKNSLYERARYNF